MQPFRAFSGKRLEQYLAENDRQAVATVEQETKEAILHADDTTLAQQIADNHKVKGLTLDFDGIKVSMSEKTVSIKDLPETYEFYGTPTMQRQVATYHIPIAGNLDLLGYQPSTHQGGMPEVYLESKDNQRRLCFEAMNTYNDADGIKAVANSFINGLRTQLGYIAEQIERYNAHLHVKVGQAIDARREHIKQRESTVNNLGFPVEE